jgi:hypothetical protein
MTVPRWTGSDLLGVFLLVHLGTVMGLFLAMPYGKFIHGFYRVIALVGFALEQRRGHQVLGRAAESPPRRQAAE